MHKCMKCSLSMHTSSFSQVIYQQCPNTCAWKDIMAFLLVDSVSSKKKEPRMFLEAKILHIMHLLKPPHIYRRPDDSWNLYNLPLYTHTIMSITILNSWTMPKMQLITRHLLDTMALIHCLSFLQTHLSPLSKFFPTWHHAFILWELVSPLIWTLDRLK